MTKILFFLCILPFLGWTQISDDCVEEAQSSLENPGLYSTSSINESDNIRNGPLYNGATIFYPSNSSGTLSCIVLVPGFMNQELTILNWGPYLSAHGFVVMTIGTNSLTQNPVDRKEALLDAIITLKAENNRLASPLYNQIDTNRIGVGGFSMGGGGAQLAAASDSTIKAVIALYPFLSDADQQMLNHNVPLLVVSGQLDVIALPSQHANIHYNVTPNSTAKQRFEIQFASHDPLSGPNGGSGDAGKRVLGWLHTFLNDDSCFCPTLIDAPSSASDFEHNIQCQNLFIEGCTDYSACNYNANANIDNGSCQYPLVNYDCEGNCLYGDIDQDNLCDCEIMDTIISSCNCEFIDENTYSIFYTNIDEENCFLIEDCYCECYNDFDNDGICDENEVSFNCDNSICINPLDGTGSFSSLEDCQLSCGLNLRWDCIDNSCISVNQEKGEYLSQEECEKSCLISSVVETNSINKKLKKVTNLLGQEISILKNTLMIYIYEDGTMKKKIILE
jgi:dienelactone hydrolase